MRHALVTAVLVLAGSSAAAEVPDHDPEALPSGFTGEIAIGFVARRLHSTFDSTQLAGAAPNYMVARSMEPSSTTAPLDEAGVRLRLVLGAISGFYAGADGDGLAVVSGPTVASRTLTAAPAATILMHAIVGWRHLESRHLVFGELAAGGGITSYPTACLDPSCGMRYREVGALVGDVEARVGIDWFVSPMVVIGATLGASMLDRGAFSGGVMIGVIGDSHHARRGVTASYRR